jgi:hypothetical protein
MRKATERDALTGDSLHQFPCDHAAGTTIMTKAIILWCGHDEQCGYLADRVRISVGWLKVRAGTCHEAGLSKDYTFSRLFTSPCWIPCLGIEQVHANS